MEIYNLYEPTIKNVFDIFTVVLQNTYFCFNGKYYKQISGLAMGSSVCPVLAVVYLHTLECRTLSRFNLVFYARYIDDTFIVCQNEDVALQFYNNEDSNIKFKIERPQPNGSISLLDFNVGNTGSTFEYKFYHKSAKEGHYCQL